VVTLFIPVTRIGSQPTAQASHLAVARVCTQTSVNYQ